MKTKIVLKFPALRVQLLMAMCFAILMALAPASRAGLNGPYAPDYDTLHLWPLQDTNGTIAGIATNGVYFYDLTTNPMVNPLVASNYVNVGANQFGQAGQPGPGATSYFQTYYGTNFGYALSFNCTTDTSLILPVGPVGYPVPCTFPPPGLYNDGYAYTNNSCSFVNTNTGAYTWEALVQPAFSLATVPSFGPEILCSDGGNSTPPGANPYTIRANQLRITGQQLEWNGNINAIGSQIHDVKANLPSSGPDQFIQGNWYHVAVAFTGTSPTNGDPPDVLTMYWTSFDASHTHADVLTNFNYFYTYTNSSAHTTYTLAYPSNSIIGMGQFEIGNEPRNNGNGWVGNIAEVRISDCYRHSNEFMFNTTLAAAPPGITNVATNTLVGYGYNLNFSPSVSGSPFPALQWYQDGLPMAGQTNATLVISNMNYTLATNLWYLVATNVYGSATSVVASVTLGATFDGLFNTGCDPSGNPVQFSNPGSVDLHWTIPQNPDNGSLNAICWSTGAPINGGGTAGSVVPPTPVSDWIGPHENSGLVYGTYSFQTTFQVDETAITPTNFISGNFGACAGVAGQTMQMFLNGVETDFTFSGNPAESLYYFIITNGLQPGSNTLVCTANQNGGTAGNVGFNLAISGLAIGNDTGLPLTTAPAITNQPVGVTNVYGSTVSFQAVALGAPPLMYYWLSNGVAVTPPTWVAMSVPYLSFVATNFTGSQLAGSNYFANYQVVFSNFVGSVTSAVAALDVQLPPLTLTSAGAPIWDATNSETNIVVYFSSGVDPATATTAGNYLLDNGATVTSAALGSAPGEVILTVSTLNPATSYTLTVQNVNSSYGFPMAPSSQQLAVGTYPSTVGLWVKASTGITTDGSGDVEQWNDLSGNGNNLFGIGVPYDPIIATNAWGYPVVRCICTNATPYSIMVAGDTPTLGLTSNMTVFAVINFATLAGNTNGEIISEVNNNQPAPYDYYAGVSTVSFLRGNGTSSIDVQSAKTPTTGVPHLLDVVMNGTSVIHRLDGNTNGTGTLSATITDSGNGVSIGTRGDAYNHLNGDINELILIGQALSPSDVASMENYLITEYNLPTGTNSYPIITRQPVASTNVNQGGTLLVPAAASGTPAVGYQWYDISNVPQAGQTNATLVINNDTVADSYYLVATNVYGSATSSVVAVSLITGLNVSLGPPAVTIYAGQPFTYTAQASGNAPFYYQWSRGGSPIANATNASYTATTTSGSTTYTCTVSNAYNGYSSTNAGPVTLTGIAAPTTLYQLTVLSNNPIAYWRLNEGPDNGSGDDGTIANDYAGGHSGSYSNAVLGLAGFGMADSTDTAALFGAYNSSSSNSLVGEIDNSGSGLSPITFTQPVGSNGEFSVEAWVCSSNAAQPLGAGIVAKGYGNGGEQFDLDVYNGFRFFMRDASGGVHGPSLSTIPTVGKWYHLVGVFDGANGAVHLYTNGVDAADTTGLAGGLGVLSARAANPLLPQAALVSIGARVSGQNVTNYDLQFKGNIQDVALYNYALSAAQVAADYQASGLAPSPISLTPTNLVFAVTNNQLYLSWPANHLGWQLQAQTNPVSVGIGANWVNFNPSTTTNQVAIPINLTNGTVFYRLIYTAP